MTVTQEFYDRLVLLARAHSFLIVNDFAYSDVFFDGQRPPSLLYSDREFTNSIELYSLTKGYSMAGWRVGFALGNKEAIQSLTKLKPALNNFFKEPGQVLSLSKTPKNF